MKVNQKGMDALHRPSFFLSLNSKMSCPINDLPQIESYITLDTSIKGFTEAYRKRWLRVSPSPWNLTAKAERLTTSRGLLAWDSLTSMDWIANNLFRGRKWLVCRLEMTCLQVGNDLFAGRSSHSAASIDTLDKKKPRIKHVFIRLPQCQIC